MASVQVALYNVCKSLYNMGMRAPWLMTGIRSDPAYEHFMPNGEGYRVVAPASRPEKPIIPGDVPQLVYATKYWERDFRRNSKYVARTVKGGEGLDVSKMFASAPTKPEQIVEIVRQPTTPTRGY